MTISPVVRTVEVKAPPARAYELFVARITDWWPKGTTVSKAPHEAIVVEPKAGGAWFERDADGKVTPWGKVLVWEPPSRLVLGWQLNSRFAYDPDFLTEVEVSFAATSGGGTRVTLEHRDLERFGADAETVAEQIGRGWPARLTDYARYTDSQA